MKISRALVIFISLLSPAVPALAASTSVSVSSNAQVPTILQLSISQTGQSEIRFGNIRPSALDPTVAGPISVVIDVRSNIGSRYQLTQTMNSPLTNASGDQIAPGALVFTTTSSAPLGTAVTTPTAATASAQVIYESDASGTGNSIRADYRLTVPASQTPGDYSSLITYTVSSI